MSYFRDQLGQLPGGNEHLTLQAETAEPSQHVEVTDGVTIERRGLLWLSAAAVGALLAGSHPLRAQDPRRNGGAAARPTDGRLTYQQFLEELYPLARRIAASKGEDEEAYLMTVAATMCRLRDPAAPLRETMRAFMNKHRSEDEQFPLVAVAMKLESGKGFEHHDHLDYNGVIMPIEGEVRIRNYDFQGPVLPIDSDETFQVRMTSDDWLLPGRISTLGRNRENIHDVIAGEQGARVLDVFTFFTRRAGSRMLEVADKPRDAEKRIYDAAWKPGQR